MKYLLKWRSWVIASAMIFFRRQILPYHKYKLRKLLSRQMLL